MHLTTQFSNIRALGAMALLVLLCAVGTAGAENLVANADFQTGTPGTEEFVWKLELAAGEANECTVVEGRTAGSHALRVYNDELGSSYVSQELSVRPWRWYIADVWVNIEGMYCLGFSPWIELAGGGRAGAWGQDHYENPAFPDSPTRLGWRRLRVIAHSGESTALTFKFGGRGWSGEMLFAEPVVRECSLVEAAGSYPGPSDTHPALYGPALDPEHGQEGYAFQKGSVCRVARNFPNPFYIIGRMNTEAPEGRISLWLPEGIRFRKLQWERGKKTPQVTVLSGGGLHARGGTHLELAPDVRELVLDSDLEAGERAVGYVYYEWQGGYQVPMPVAFEGVELPNVTPPKRILTILGISGATRNLWDYDTAAMCRDIKRSGFNTVEIWGRSGFPGAYDQEGLAVATQWSPVWRPDSEKYPEALAVTIDGEPCMDRGGLMCPSYRGPACTEYVLALTKELAEQASALCLDDEWYGSSGQSPLICFDERCMKRWNQWVAEHEPGLADVEPQVFARQPHKYPLHYDAWLRFRCYLVAERYGLIRQAFFESLKETGVKTTPRPWLYAYIGGGPVVAMHSNKALRETLDYVCNSCYMTAAGVRRRVAELAPLTGKKLLVTLSPGYTMSPPGDARSQVLEAIMGGSRGFYLWGYYQGIDAGHMADIAEAIKMMGPVEDVILDGEIQPGFQCVDGTADLLARGDDGVTVLLVSDYGLNPGANTISVPGSRPAKVFDLMTRREVARLTADKRTFTISLRRDNAAHLFKIQY